MTVLIILFVLCTIHVSSAQVGVPKQPSTPSTALVSIHQIRTISEYGKEVQQRLRNSAQRFVLVPGFSSEVDLLFRTLYNVSSTGPVLFEETNKKKTEDLYSSLRMQGYADDAFVSKVPPSVPSVVEIVQAISNDSVQANSFFSWVGGTAYLFETPSSKVYGISQDCREIALKTSDKKVLRQRRHRFVRSFPPYKSTLFDLGPQNSPMLCGGSGVVFNESENLAQRLWLFLVSDQGESRRESIGSVQPDSLSKGNYIHSLSNERREGLEKLHDGASFDVSLSADIMDYIKQVQERHARSFEQYNNIAFCASSIAAILASAAVSCLAEVTGAASLVVLVVETILVYAFLALTSHLCVVFTRPLSFFVEAYNEILGEFPFGEDIVSARSEIVLMVAGVRKVNPVLVFVSEGVAVVATIAVSMALIRTLRRIYRLKRRRRPAPDFLQEEELEFYKNENRSHYSARSDKTLGK